MPKKPFPPLLVFFTFFGKEVSMSMRIFNTWTLVNHSDPIRHVPYPKAQLPENCRRKQFCFSRSFILNNCRITSAVRLAHVFLGCWSVAVFILFFLLVFYNLYDGLVLYDAGVYVGVVADGVGHF